ncbi:hypothetical protein BH11BAC7_BH11BAC7_00180 [soil metagenome]
MNFKHTFVRIFSDKGLLLTLFLSLSVMCFFYGELLLHPCSTYFGATGDGMQIYYETLFHTKYDSAFWTQNSVNYPYGESIFFTGAMPFVNNLVKIFGPSAAPLGVGLINLMMVFSPVIGALFIYAIFRHLRMPWHYGACCATFIAYLSPQLLRMYGHYSLQWVFLIPAMLYLLLRFYDQPSVLKSFAIAFLVFLGASTHLYFLAFFAAIGGVYWAVLFLTRDRGFGRITFVLKHTAIQFILPVVILELLVMMSDHVTDRTTAPWGFLIYHSNLTGVLFPMGKPYESIFRFFAEPQPVELEGMAYIGLAAVIGLITVIIVQFVRLFRGRFKLFFAVTDHKVLNIFFWTSLFMLWFSFGHPFVDGHEGWLPYLGPVRQFRAVGRFTWIFFYVINIIAAYRLYKLVQQRKIVSYIVMTLVVSFLFIDMYSLNHARVSQFDNHIAALDDEENTLPENAWLINFNSAAYQAILPLPYFHVGSENICRPIADPEIVQTSYIVSLKTGLPMMGVSSARTSLSQSAKLISLVLDPVRPLELLNDIKDKRPILVIVREATLDELEKNILALSKPIAVSKEYKIYSLDPELLKTLQVKRYERVRNDHATARLFPAGIFSSTDSSASFAYRSFDGMNNIPAYRGKGAYQGKIYDGNRLFDSTMAVPGEYIGSFWFNHIDGDIYPRLAIEVFCKDTTPDAKSFYNITNAVTGVKVIDGHWGLVEFPVTVPVANAHLQITVWNKEMKKDQLFEIDELMIRPKDADFYLVKGDTIIRNTRVYYPQK